MLERMPGASDGVTLLKPLLSGYLDCVKAKNIVGDYKLILRVDI